MGFAPFHCQKGLHVDLNIQKQPGKRYILRYALEETFVFKKSTYH